MDITTIPTGELEKDLLESLQDIAVCDVALILGETTYSGGSIQERRDSNKHFVEVITAELKRRKVKYEYSAVKGLLAGLNEGA